MSAALAFAVAGPFAQPAPRAQQKVEPQEAVRLPKAPQHEVGVTLKLIQVVVTDKPGNPVTDLKKEDFVLTDNGKPVSITEFEWHDLKVPAEPGGRPAEAAIVPTPLPDKPALLNRKIIFFFDFGYASARGILKAREEALRFVDKSLLPSDEVSVMTYSLWDRLQVKELPTTDHARVRAAIAGIGAAEATGVAEERLDRMRRRLGADVSTGVEAGTPTFQGTEGANRTRPVKQSDIRQHVRMYITYMTSLAQALRLVPGQKTLVNFTMGIDGSIIYAVGAGTNADLRASYENLLKELATSNIVVYSMDTSDKADPDYVLPESVKGDVSMRRMAQATGGEFMGHVDESAAHLRRIQTLTAAYYVLGYPIPETWDGKFHRIEVEVKRPGCEVRTQSGYLNPKPFSAFTKLERDIHLVDLALTDKPFGQVPLAVPATALLTSLGREAGLCLLARLPVAEIRGKWSGGPVEILGLVFDPLDVAVSWQRTEAAFGDKRWDDAFLASWARLPAGAYRCRIVVRDLETGAAAVGRVAITVPENKDGLVLLPPLLVRPEKGASFINQGGPREAKGTGAAAALGFDPARYAPYLETTLEAGADAWVVVPCSGPGSDDPGLEIRASLIDPQTRDEIPVQAEIAGVTKTDGACVRLLRLVIPEVEPDEYRLIIAARGPDGKEAAIARDYVIK